MSPDDLERLEALLRGLPLRQAPAGLDDRLAQTWAGRARRRKRLAAGVALAASLAIAAGLAAVLLVYRGGVRQPVPPPEGTLLTDVRPVLPEPGRQPPQAAPSGPATPPVRIEQVWCTPLGSQVVMRDDAPPILEERRQVTRRLSWIDDRQHVKIQWIVSNEETVVVPLDYN